MFEYEIMLGLNDKDTHKQEFNIDFVIDIVGRWFDSCTIQKCIGFYKGEKENSLKITVYTEKSLEYMKYQVGTFGLTFNQECVILKDCFLDETFFINPADYGTYSPIKTA